MTPFSLCVYLGKCEKRPGHKKATNLGFRAAFAAIIPPWARSALVTIWFDGTNLNLEREPWILVGWKMQHAGSGKMEEAAAKKRASITKTEALSAYDPKVTAG
jgi:hypothetical protein